MPTYTIKPSGGDTAAPLNLRKRLALLHKYAQLQGLRILDCGCGTGQYVLALLQLGADAWGIEYDADKVSAYGRDNPDYPRRVMRGDLEHIAFNDDSFDFALLNEVLEHIPDDGAALREIRRVLKPNGRLLIFSPNRLYPFETHGVHLKESGRRLPPYVPFIPYLPVELGGQFLDYWARNYWPHELRHLVATCGFEVVRTSYLWQTFENISGHQPYLLRMGRPALRTIANLGERMPVVRTLGASQVVLAQRIR